MQHKLPKLPYPKGALEPWVSRETVEYHYGKHHAGYFKKLNKALQSSSRNCADQTLEQLVRNTDSSEPDILNNAAQAWNHCFYWNSMSPGAQTKPNGALLRAIKHKFGTFSELKSEFTNAAKAQFGSGWAWLVLDADGGVSVVSTSNEGNPMRDDAVPLLVCDVWEHAYYIDYRNKRGEYLDAFWRIANWKFAQQQFDAINARRAA